MHPLTHPQRLDSTKAVSQWGGRWGTRQAQFMEGYLDAQLSQAQEQSAAFRGLDVNPLGGSAATATCSLAEHRKPPGISVNFSWPNRSARPVPLRRNWPGGSAAVRQRRAHHLP